MLGRQECERGKGKREKKNHDHHRHFPLYMHKRFGLMDTSWVATAVIVRIGRIKRGKGVVVGEELSTLL